MKESKEVAIWKMFLAWEARFCLMKKETLRRKTFWWAMYAFEKSFLILHS